MAICQFPPGVNTCPVCGLYTPNTATPRNCRGERVVDINWTASLDSSGPGTELSKLLKRFGIEPTPTCACRAKAAEMDAWGPDECEKPERIAEVVAIMRAESEARGLPFFNLAGRLLVRRAIANARRNA